MLLFFSFAEPENGPSVRHKKIEIEEEIFVRIGQNDMAAFEAFYRQTERTVYAYALSILRNHDDAMDVLQDTYLKIRGAAHLYKPMGKPMAWVFTITRNLAMSRLRLRQREDDSAEENFENQISFSYVEDPVDRLVMETVLKILSDEEREIILLHAVSGFTHREIAKNLGIPLSTALSKYHRGLRKLRNYLSDKGVRS